MGNALLVSVIIPVYNVAPFLRESLDSVIHQTYKDLEIIIIDDGSTDESGKICDEYAIKDMRIHVVHQKNCGLGKARNHGLDIMTGEVVTFLDSDDAFHPDYISLMIDKMIKENTDIVLCKFVTQITEGSLCFSTPPDKAAPSIKAGLYNRKEALCALVDGEITSQAWNKLYRKELWDNTRFPEGQVYEDIATTYRILNLCKSVFVLENVLYLYRKRKGSITSSYTVEVINDWLASQHDVEVFLRAHIPDVFTEKQLEAHLQLKFKEMVFFYTIHFLNTDSKVKCFTEALRKKIIKASREIDLEKQSIRTKIKYYFIRYCPCFFRIAYVMFRQSIRTK